MPRFSMRTLLLTIAGFAFVLFALMSTSYWPVAIIRFACLIGLAAVTLASFFSLGAGRAYFIGAAVTGWWFYIETQIYSSLRLGESVVEPVGALRDLLDPNQSMRVLIPIYGLLLTAAAAMVGGWYSAAVYRRYYE